MTLFIVFISLRIYCVSHDELVAHFGPSISQCFICGRANIPCFIPFWRMMAHVHLHLV